MKCVYINLYTIEPLNGKQARMTYISNIQCTLLTILTSLSNTLPLIDTKMNQF